LLLSSHFCKANWCHTAGDLGSTPGRGTLESETNTFCCLCQCILATDNPPTIFQLETDC
jgi:hypothetical protein